MTLFSLLEDKVGPGVVNTYKSPVIRRGHNPFSNQTGLCLYFQFSGEDRHKLFCGPMLVPALVYDIITILSEHTVIFPIKC